MPRAKMKTKSKTINPSFYGRDARKVLPGAQITFLHPKQMEVYRSTARFRVVAAGRRWGKSKLSLMEMIRAATAKRNQLVWYIAPTYQMARQIMWADLIANIPREWMLKDPHETRLTIYFKNGSVIQLKGADKEDTLRGVGLNFVVLDEFQDMKIEVWSRVIRPTLSTTKGRALVIGSPKSFNSLYALYKMGQDMELQKANKWMSWQFPTRTSPFVPEQEIEDAKRDMDERSFKQEYEADFSTMSNLVYYAFDRNVHVRPCTLNPKLPIWIGMDFNIDPMSAIFMQPQKDGSLHVFGEKLIFNSNTEEMAAELERLFWRHHRLVTIYPDPQGRQRSHTRGESDFTILRQKGFRLRFRKNSPKIRDRVNAVNRMLRAGDGVVRLRIDPSCKGLIESLEQTQYKLGTSEIDKAKRKEHATDALGYPIEIEFPVRSHKAMGASV